MIQLAVYDRATYLPVSVVMKVHKMFLWDSDWFIEAGMIECWTGHPRLVTCSITTGKGSEECCKMVGHPRFRHQTLNDTRWGSQELG